MKYLIKPLKKNEYHILEKMLYEAIYQPDEDNLIPKKVIEEPEIRTYIDNFGEKKGDYCFVAKIDGTIVGTVWTRILADDIKGFGFIDSETPEFAISLFKEYRSKGIGTKLMRTMIEHLRNSGYKQTSLNVKKENYAVQLYKNMGFRIIDEDSEDYLMLLELI